ncbi:MAG TPA: sodium/proton-translocating pyrophosphatase [Polyangiaceae bacterium]|nr:sodium/proton-translocating pyrophosphatase [Polyangiaceae bacterium]
MSELIVVFLLCACGVIVVVSHARGLAGSATHHRELDRLLAAVDRACADFLWRETRLLGLLLLALAVALSVPIALWQGGPADTGARIVLSVTALLLGAAGGAGVARATHWAAARATARALAELREEPLAASSSVLRGATLAALLADAASLLLPWGFFVAHSQYLIWVARVDRGMALLEAARSAPLCALGATCAAVVFQIGGSSFQTAASVAGSGARARDRRVALDDEQNPTLIAELVGSYVGGVVFRSTDVFAALALANSTLIALAGAVFQANSLAADAGVANAGAALALLGLPLLVRASGSLAAALALGSLRFEAGRSPARAFSGAGASQAVIAAAGLLGATLWLLGDPLWAAGFGAGALGIASSLACQGLLLAPRASSVDGQSALSSLSPAAEHARGSGDPITSLARALGVGLQRAWAPLLIAGAGLGGAYALGAKLALQHGGAYALLLAVAGMLGSAALHLCSSAFASIGANLRRVGALRRGHYDLAARGRAAELAQSARAIGNWGDTQSILAASAAALLGAVTLPLGAARLPGAASMDETARALGSTPLVGVGHPIVIVGGLLGITSLSFYVGGVLQNSSRAASALDEELAKERDSALPRAESEAPSALPTASAARLPSYRGSVQRAASAATDAILPLAAAALLSPMIIGVLMRLVYGPSGARYTAQGLMALAAIAGLTGACAALAAQGALTALGLARRPPEASGSTAPSQGQSEPAPAGSVPGVASFGLASFSAEAAREFVGHSVGPAALLGLKATVVSALAIAPLLFPSAF